MRVAILVAILLCLGLPALARVHQHHNAPPSQYAVGAQTVLSYTPNSQLASIAGRYLGGNPTGWSHNWCGLFMGMIAKQAGLNPPPGYMAARSWERAGSPTPPAPGAIGIFRGGHHVGIVLQVAGDRVLIRSGNHGHRVADGWYPIRNAVFRRL